jgi:hypothetical protein
MRSNLRRIESDPRLLLFHSVGGVGVAVGDPCGTQRQSAHHVTTLFSDRFALRRGPGNSIMTTTTNNFYQHFSTALDSKRSLLDPVEALRFARSLQAGPSSHDAHGVVIPCASTPPGDVILGRYGD